MDSFWDFFWFILSFFLLMAYLMVLVQVLMDLFSDRRTSGWAKAAWMFFLIFLPMLTALVYLVVRGNGMAERAGAKASAAGRPATSGSPTEEIERAKRLLDDGVIDRQEFDSLKARSLV